MRLTISSFVLVASAAALRIPMAGVGRRAAVAGIVSLPMSAPAGTSLARRDRKAAFDTALDSDWSSKILAFRVRKRSTRMAFQSEFVAVIVPEYQTENTCAAGAWEMRKFCFLFWPIPPWELAVERCRDSFLAFGSLNARGVRSYRARRTEHPGLHSGRRCQ